MLNYKKIIIRFFLKKILLSSIFDLIIKFRFYSIIRSLIYFYIVNSNVNLKQKNILYISRPIFDQDIEVLKKNSTELNYLKIDKFIFTKLFYSIFNLRPNIHRDYHLFTDINNEKNKYYNLLNKIFVKIFQKLNIKIIISSNYVYCWQQEFAKLSIKLKIPFIVLLKEGILPESELNLVWEKYSNKKFIGTKLFVYNELIKKSLINSKVINLNQNNIVVTGIPRLKELIEFRQNNKNYNETNNKILFLSFFVQDKIRHLNLDKFLIKKLETESKQFHINVIKFAINNSDYDLIIKTKNSPKYINYIYNIFDQNKLQITPNIKINYEDSSINLVKESKFIITSATSTSLFESLLMNKIVCVPKFTYFKQTLLPNDLINVIYHASSYSDLNNFLSLNKINFSKSNTDLFLKHYINYDKNPISPIIQFFHEVI